MQRRSDHSGNLHVCFLSYRLSPVSSNLLLLTNVSFTVPEISVAKSLLLLFLLVQAVYELNLVPLVHCFCARIPLTHCFHVPLSRSDVPVFLSEVHLLYFHVAPRLVASCSRPLHLCANTLNHAEEYPPLFMKLLCPNALRCPPKIMPP